MKGSVNVAIIGVGNCASSLVQGVHYYRDAKDDEFVPGLMHTTLGGYHISDINFTAAIDIDARKVGRDLSEAIYTEPNNTFRFAEVPKSGVTVQRGMPLAPPKGVPAEAFARWFTGALKAVKRVPGIR